LECFCIEGTHLLEEFLKTGKKPIQLIATEKWLLKNNLLLKKINSSLISKVSNAALASAISTQNPDGVAALVNISSISNYIYAEKDDFILVLDRIQDPGNLGNIFRTALAGGVNKVLLGGGANPLSPKVLRSSCGSVFHLPFKRIDGHEQIIINKLLKALKDLKERGFQIILTNVEKEDSNNLSKPYWELNWLKPTVLILGNEGSGINPKIKEAFTETITIPHSKLVQSLNVASVAVPLLLERNRAALT